MKRIGLVITFILLSLSVTNKVSGQANAPQDNISSSFSGSPNVSGNQYSPSIGVNCFTGSAQVGYTIFNFQSTATGLAHSISLGYRGGGMRTDDLASNVGLGWNLSYAPTISREVRGRPDETEMGFESLPKENINSQDTARLHRVANDLEDAEMDQYSFNTQQSSGDFIIGKGGIIKQLQSSNMRIERYFDNGVPLFIITAPDGTQYYYDVVSTSRLQYGDSTSGLDNVIWAPVTWQVSKIVSAFHKDSIQFNYTSHPVKFDGGFSFVDYKQITPDTSTSSYTYRKAISQRMVDQRIQNIQYPNGTTVTFTYDNFPRLDMREDNALASIAIQNAFTNTSYSFRFQYSYYSMMIGQAAAMIPYQDYTGTAEANFAPGTGFWNKNPDNYFRLFLHNFHIESGNDTMTGYTFNYNNNHLPVRGNNGTDHWGFYNGSSTRIPGVGVFSGASKSPGSGSFADILQSISLPTGGTKQFEYELNSSQGYLTYNIGGIAYYKSNSYGQPTTSTLYYDDDTMASAFPPIPLPQPSASAKVVYRIIITPGEWPTNLTGNQNLQIDFFKKKPSKNYIINSSYATSIPFSSSTFANNISDTVEFTALSTDIVTYRIHATISPVFPGPTYIPFNIQVNAYNTSTVPPGPGYTVDVLVGGARVKKIVTTDGTNQSNNNVREYKYTTISNVSSGVKGNDPIYDFTYSESYVPVSGSSHPAVPQGYPVNYYNYDLVSGNAVSNASSGAFYKYFVRSSAAQNSIQYFNGCPVGYSRVEEYDGTVQNNRGKVVYEYSTNPQSGSDALPFIPRRSEDFKNGIPQKISVYNKAGVLLKTTENFYDIFEQELTDTAFVSAKVAVTAHPLNASGISIANYNPVAAKVLPVKTIQTEYFPGQNSIVSITQKVYDTSKMVLKEVRGLDARGNKIRTAYFYPFEFSPSGAIGQLQALGMVYAPIRTETWRDTINPKLLGAAISTSTQITGMIKQDASFALAVTAPVSATSWYSSFTAGQLFPVNQPMKKMVQMDAYDAKGNVIQSTAKGLTTTTVWDYNSCLPIANISNAAVSDVAYTSFEADGLGGWAVVGSSSGSSQSDRVTGRKCGVLQTTYSLQKAGLDPAKTYTLTCWCKQGAPVATLTTNGQGSTVTYSTTSFTASDAHNGWTLYRATFSNAAAVALSSPTGSPHLIDELRLYPKGASITTTTYDPLCGVTSICDAANHTAYTEYDAFGRMLYQKDLDGHIIKAFEYKNAEPQY